MPVTSPDSSCTPTAVQRSAGEPWLAVGGSPSPARLREERPHQLHEARRGHHGEMAAARDSMEDAPRDQPLRLLDELARIEAVASACDDQRRGFDRAIAAGEVERVFCLDRCREIREVADLAR